MDVFRQYLNSMVNRLVAVIILVHIVINALFADNLSGLELYHINNDNFRAWQLFSYMFLHADWWHLGLNMLALWSFGRGLEMRWGGQRFLVFFIVCGLCAALVHLGVNYFEYSQLLDKFFAAGMTSTEIREITIYALDVSARFDNIETDDLRRLWALHNGPAIGASGSVYGVLVAYAMLYPNFKVMLIFLPIPIAAKYFVPVLLLLDLAAGLTQFSIFGYNIAHFAHLGGALAGFLLVLFWLKDYPTHRFN